jgi:predicted transcriptional regulator
VDHKRNNDLSGTIEGIKAEKIDIAVGLYTVRAFPLCGHEELFSAHIGAEIDTDRRMRMNDTSSLVTSPFILRS